MTIGNTRPTPTPPAPPRPGVPLKKPPQSVIDNYKSLRAAVDKADRLVLELLHHPESTPEHITLVAASCRNCWATLKEVHESCRRIFGESYSTYKPYPWEKAL